MKPQLSREDADNLVDELHDAVIELINEQVTRKHHAGDFDAGSLVYITTTALADAITNIMFTQVPLEQYSEEQHERLLNSFCKMLRDKANTIVEYRKAHGGRKIGISTTTSDSLWD